MDKLKPCPFCDGAARAMTTWDLRGWFVSCSICGIETRRDYRSRKEAIEAWNRRVNIEMQA